MLRLFFLALVLPGVMSSCCLPKKFTATRTNALTGLRSFYVADFETQRILVKPDKHPVVTSIINDIKTNISYTMLLDGSCKKRNVNKHFLYYRCMPPSAKLEHAEYIGPESMRTETYSYNYGKFVQVKLTVSKDKCFPVMKVQHPINGWGASKSILFTSVKEVTNTDKWLKLDFNNCVDDFGVIG